MNRRKFVTTLGLSGATPAFSTLWNSPIKGISASTSIGRSRVALRGEWEHHVNGKLLGRIQIPSSQRPTGFYHLRRHFLLPRLSTHERAVLHFDAITYYGEASVNGAELGTMGPYVPHELEFTRQAKEGNNQVEVGIADLTPAPDGEGKAALKLGVNPGWEAYGGIIRDVYAEIRPAAFVENVKLGYTLSRDYSRADCQVTVFVSSAKSGPAQLEVSLEQGESEVAHAEKSFQAASGVTEVGLQFEVRAPALWSPEAPNLYEMTVRLRSEAGEDEWKTRTGFREVRIEGNRFVLNGEPLVLKGVCRHDMWKGEGFTLTRAQREQDMRMIKELGCNFARLVHYPHDRQVIELADEVGLLVSEEPGYWGMDFTTMPKAMIELGYEIMERTISRDWNSPSVFAWLLGNECKLTVEYLKEGKARCRRLDPLARPVSFANDMPMAQAKPIYEQAGMDFFDQHIYTYNLDDFTHATQFYGAGRPLTFTEWGGRAIGQSQIVMEYTVNRLMELVQRGVVAGHVFWSWEDMRQYSRVDEEMHDGVLESGVVTENREPRTVPSMELARLFEGRRSKKTAVTTKPAILPLKRIPWAGESVFVPIDLQPLVSGPSGAKSWAAFEARMAKFWEMSKMARDQWKRTGERFLLWREPVMKIAGVSFQVPAVNGYVRPVMLTPAVPEVVIPVEREGVRLHVLGHVTLPEGFPVDGRNGETIAKFTIHYLSGEADEIALRNGYDVARSNLIYEATRINPEAVNTQRALLFIKDIAREHYQVLLSSHALRQGRVRNIRYRLLGQHPLAIFAMTLEAAR